MCWIFNTLGRGYGGGINVSCGQFLRHVGGALLPSCLSWQEYLLLLLRLLLCGWADLLLKCIVGELSVPTLLIIPTLLSHMLRLWLSSALCNRWEVSTSLDNWLQLLLQSLCTPAL